MLISIFTGLTAGALHVVCGIDHLVVMAPNAFHQTRIALKNGLAWGLGHSVGVLALSTFAILINDLAHIE